LTLICVYNKKAYFICAKQAANTKSKKMTCVIDCKRTIEDEKTRNLKLKSEVYGSREIREIIYTLGNPDIRFFEDFALLKNVP
jgi:hypothetical protein